MPRPDPTRTRRRVTTSGNQDPGTLDLENRLRELKQWRSGKKATTVKLEAFLKTLFNGNEIDHFVLLVHAANGFDRRHNRLKGELAAKFGKLSKTNIESLLLKLYTSYYRYRDHARRHSITTR